MDKYLLKQSNACIICLLFLLVCGCGKDNPQQDGKKPAAPKSEPSKILVVHSYHPEYEWVAAVNRGLQMVILPAEARVETYYMDTKRRTDKASMETAGQKAIALIDEWQPDVVVTVDDDAQRYVGQLLAGRTAPVVVFCGVNGKPEEYHYPAANVTGVLERLHFNESLAFYKTLFPQAQRIVFLTDYSATSQAVIAYIKTLPPGAMEVVDYVTPFTFDQWKDAVSRYSQQVDAIAVYVYHTVKQNEQATVSMPARDVMAWTTQNSPVPILGFLVFSVDDGSLCGVLESGVEQGQLAGQMVVEILHGKHPDELPIVTGTRGQTMINMQAAKQWGVAINPAILKEVDVIVDKPQH